ncbi:MAG: DegT/DnrJ/EryC1/StrS family aminotransferase, partial [Thermoproteota archaeon]
IRAVHLYGHPADMKPLREIAEDHKLVLIEDAAQAHGAEYMGRKAGSLGDTATFSFYPTKNMTTGEGGMVTTNDKRVAERVRLLRDHGQVEKYLHVEL